MDFFLTVVGVVMLAGLLYVCWIEWHKSTQEQKINMIETLTAAAQQIHGLQPGPVRYDWVARRVKERWPKIDGDELMILIEAAVCRLKLLAGSASDGKQGASGSADQQRRDQ